MQVSSRRLNTPGSRFGFRLGLIVYVKSTFMNWRDSACIHTREMGQTKHFVASFTHDKCNGQDPQGQHLALPFLAKDPGWRP